MNQSGRLLTQHACHHRSCSQSCTLSSSAPWVEESFISSSSGPREPDMWKEKPAWCQPWSILTTGAGIVFLAATLSESNPFVVGLVGIPVAVWW